MKKIYFYRTQDIIQLCLQNLQNLQEDPRSSQSLNRFQQIDSMLEWSESQAQREKPFQKGNKAHQSMSKTPIAHILLAINSEYYPTGIPPQFQLAQANSGSPHVAKLSSALKSPRATYLAGGSRRRRGNSRNWRRASVGEGGWEEAEMGGTREGTIRSVSYA